MIFLKGSHFKSNTHRKLPNMKVGERPWWEFHWLYVSIGSGNGLMPNKRQAIIWINDSLTYWLKYASLGLSELKFTLSFNCQDIQSITKSRVARSVLKSVAAIYDWESSKTHATEGNFNKMAFMINCFVICFLRSRKRHINHTNTSSLWWQCLPSRNYREIWNARKVRDMGT